MADQLDEKVILETFDDLLERGFIVYRETEAEICEDRGFLFQFRVCSALSRKPQLQDVSESTNTRKFGPGSDLEFADDKLLLTTVNGTHHLVLNKFCVFRPQYVLLTADSYCRQDESLSFDDFQAVLNISARLQRPHYFLYNCMEPAGSSRKHKHLQIFKYPTDFPLFPDRPDSHKINAPYVYFLHRFSSTPPSAQLLLETYQILLSNAKQTMGTKSQRNDEACPHNVILVREWMLVIPRRRSNVDDTSANGAGMMGMLWVKDEAKLQQWKSLGPAWILSQLGVAKHHSGA